MFGIAGSTTTVQRVVGVLVIGMNANGQPQFNYIGEEGSSPMNLGNNDLIGLPMTGNADGVKPVMKIEPDVVKPPVTRRKRRTKAEIEAAKATVITPPAAPAAPPPVIEETVTTPAAATKAKGGRKKKAASEEKPEHHNLKVWLPLNQVCGFAMYAGKNKTFPVAIWDVSTSQKTGVAYKLAFITKEEKAVKDNKGQLTGVMMKHAYHEQGDWAVSSDCPKLSHVKMM